MKPILNLLLLFVLLAPHLSMAQPDANFRNITITQSDHTVQIFFTLIGGVTCSGVKVERSVDGVYYSVIEEIEGVCGTPLSDATYQVVDETPLYNRVTYYRINLESLHTTSLPISFRYIDYQPGAVSIFPNPCRDNCELFFPNQNGLNFRVMVHNLSGQLVYSTLTRQNRVNFNGSRFSRGAYQVSISYNDVIRYRGTVIVP